MTLFHLDKTKRIAREKATIFQLIRLYCHDHHPAEDALCPNCDALYRYALQRIEHCPFQQAKPTCANCTVHCYKPAMRSQVRQVMRYAGPRLLLRHPGLTLLHLLDGRLMKAPALPGNSSKN